MCSTRQGFKDDLSLREMVSGVFFIVSPKVSPTQTSADPLGISWNFEHVLGDADGCIFF